MSLCATCEGDVNIDKISATSDDINAITVYGNIETEKIILEQGGQICIKDDTGENCLTYNDIDLLLQWKDNDCVSQCVV